LPTMPSDTLESSLDTLAASLAFNDSRSFTAFNGALETDKQPA